MQDNYDQVGAKVSQYKTWYSSPRDPVTGRLKLVNNLFFLKKIVVSTQHEYYNTQKASTHLRAAYYSSMADYKYYQGWGNSAYQRAFSRFREAIWGDAQTLFSVDVAERKQALKLVHNSATRIAVAAIHVKRGKWAVAAKALGLNGSPKGVSKVQGFADNWLAYRYGWTPLVGSIYAGALALDQPVGTSFAEGGALEYINKSYDELYFKETISGVWRSRLKARVSVAEPTLATLNQFGVANPLLVAWELVPFSFVGDWFVDVGSYLENVSAFWGLQLDDLSLTEKFSVTDDLTAVPRSYQVYTNVKVGQVLKQAGVRMKVQTKPVNPPLPDLRVYNGLNTTRAIDAVALVATILKRK